MIGIETAGPLTGEAAGIVLKEAVKRAGAEIRRQRLSFESGFKAGRSGKMDDVFTSADTAAQEIMLKILREVFPNAGIIAEEKRLIIKPNPGCEIYITIDPMDGTRAFKRRQSRGVGSMVALIENGRVLSAWIYDVYAREVVGYRPGSDKVHCVFDDGGSLRLAAPTRRLREAYVLLRDPLDKYSATSASMVQKFRSHEIEGGSIGVWMMRLFKGECGGVIMLPSDDNPWDVAPIYGIALKLGYVFLRPFGDSWERYEPYIGPEVQPRDHDTLIVHERALGQIRLRAIAA